MVFFGWSDEMTERVLGCRELPFRINWWRLPCRLSFCRTTLAKSVGIEGEPASLMDMLSMFCSALITALLMLLTLAFS